MEYATINNLRISKLTLGTAQLGSHYGIANTEGELDYGKSQQIIKTALNNGITCFDTAPVYGDSEKKLGYFLSIFYDSPKPPVIVTKLPPLNPEHEGSFNNIYSLVEDQVVKSITQLQIKQIPIYLLHRASDIFAYKGRVIESLLDLKGKGLIGVLGVSVYTPEEVEAVLNSGVFGAIQVPINIFDHRLIKTELLADLRKKNFIVFARSIFLQGLLFLDSDAVPQSLSIAKKPLKLLHDLGARWNIDIAEISLAFVRDLRGITSVIIGAETPIQLLKNIELMDSQPLPADLRAEIISIFAELPPELINPSMWGEIVITGRCL